MSHTSRPPHDVVVGAGQREVEPWLSCSHDSHQWKSLECIDFWEHSGIEAYYSCWFAARNWKHLAIADERVTRYAEAIIGYEKALTHYRRCLEICPKQAEREHIEQIVALTEDRINLIYKFQESIAVDDPAVKVPSMLLRDTDLFVILN